MKLGRWWSSLSVTLKQNSRLRRRHRHVPCFPVAAQYLENRCLPTPTVIIYCAGLTSGVSSISEWNPTNPQDQSVGITFQIDEAQATDLIVSYSFGGTAILGSDYTGPAPTGSVLIPAGQLTFPYVWQIPVNAVADALVEGDETIIFNIPSTSDYNGASRTLTIRDNLAPTATDDGPYSVRHNRMILIPMVDLLTNDTDLNGHALTFVPGTATNGTLYVNSNDNSISFAPTPNFVSAPGNTASFTYRASDGALESNLATVTINVTNEAPIAVNDGPYSGLHDRTIPIPIANLLSNDTDPDDFDDEDPLRILLQTATNGSVSINDNGTPSDLTDDSLIDFVPTPGYIGSASFTYKLNDGFADSNTATVIINVTNTTPTGGDDDYSVPHNQSLVVDAPGLLANDFDADGDALTISVVDYPEHGYVILNSSDGSFEYVPDEEYVGEDSFTYTVSDGIAESAITTVSLDVLNAPPTAVDDFLDDASSRVVSYFDLTRLLDNDFDSDDEHDSLVVDSVDLVSELGATVSIVSGQLVYDPTSVLALQTLSDYDIATDIIGYALRDPHAELAYATINLQVQRNRPPEITAIRDQITLKDKPTAVLKFDANDHRDETPDNAVTLTATSSNQVVIPNGGLAISTVMGRERQIIVTPAAGAVGEAIITVTVDDNDGKQTSTTFKVTVEANLRLIGIAIHSGAGLIGEGPNIASNYDAAAATVDSSRYAHFRAVLNDANQGLPLPAGFTINWTGGTDAFSLSPLERKVDRNTALKEVLTVSDNLGNTFGMHVYIIKVVHTGFKATDGDTHSSHNHPHNNRRFKLGLQIHDPVKGKISGGMESEWTVTPPALMADQGVMISGTGIEFDPEREYLVLRYRRNMTGALIVVDNGDRDSGHDTANWKSDKTSSTDNIPWGTANGRMYFNDRPGTDSNAIGAMSKELFYYHNFREWFVIRIGTEAAVSEKFSWHSFQAVERNATTNRFQLSAAGTNSIGIGHLFWGMLPPELNSRRPSFMTAVLPNAQSSVAYNQVIGAMSAIAYPGAALKYEVVDGSLPDGINLHQDTGALSGTTFSDGIFRFRVRLTHDVAGAIANYFEFALTVTM